MISSLGTRKREVSRRIDSSERLTCSLCFSRVDHFWWVKILWRCCTEPKSLLHVVHDHRQRLSRWELPRTNNKYRLTFSLQRIQCVYTYRNIHFRFVLGGWRFVCKICSSLMYFSIRGVIRVWWTRLITREVHVSEVSLRSPSLKKC